MKCGVHTIRSGLTSAHNPASSRRYTLDNGNYDLNMKIKDLQIFPMETSPSDREDFGTTAIFFVIATSEAGAIPTASTSSPDEYSAVLSLRPSDSRQIAWGVMSPAYGYVYATVDPEHIIPEDLYVNAWSISSGGSLNPVPYGIGFIIRMEQIKSSGKEGLLYQAKTNLLE